MMSSSRFPAASAWIVAILVLFCLAGTLYSTVTPIFEASDELWHYPVVQHIAAGRGLPVQTPPERAGLWKQEASQPPLYYALAGLLTAWVDTSDFETVLRPNPHAAAGEVTPDGNINLVVHDPAREAWPWRGTVLAVRLVRLLSVALGAATVYLTYRLGQAAFPSWPEIALGAAAFNAFTPMFVFISGSVNNDNLAVPLCGLALWMMAQQNEAALGQARRLSLGWLALGAIIGLATLSKASGIVLLLPAALAGAWVAWRHRSWRHLFAAGTAIGLPVLLLSGWWFWRNLRLYGDLLGFSAFTPYFSRAVPADLAQIWSERTSFLYGYWGNFGGLNVPIPAWSYALLNGVLVIAAVGLAVRAARGLLAALRKQGLASPSACLESRFNSHFPLFIISLWAGVVCAGWINWTHTTWSSQGRLVFSAISSYSILATAGLAALLPRRAAPYGLGLLGAGMALLTLAAPFAVIAPAYARPAPLTPAQLAAIPQRTDVTFGEALTLLGYAAPASRAQPGDLLTITLYWQALAPPEQEYSVFVHLLDEADIEVQDKGPAYPGRGRLPTSTLVPGQTWAETWVVPVRATAYAPARLVWEVGLYDAASGTRLQAEGVGDSLRLGHLTLDRPAGYAYNPTSYNFDDQIELLGFDLDRRTAAPGETLTLSLAWRAVTAPKRDYTVFAHVLQPPQTIWAGSDKQPQPPTSAWQPGQVVSDTYALTLNPATPPGTYEVEVGVYYFTGDAAIERLKVLTRDGRQQQDFVLLSRVRVMP